MGTVLSSNSTDEKVGAVLVIGGGIGGIQASLDLAESGYYVYLVESSPAIGGVMAQLDKTFPTNDCSMCILSPKLVECGRHLNIETLTYSEVLDVQGESGHFRATIRRKPRYVDSAKCTGCGECPEVCPVGITSEFDEGLVDRKAIYRPYAQAFPNIFTIDKRERPPCVMTCPAGVNVQGYVALISQGKYEEALQLIYENLPLPGILGRICHHPCEAECNRASLDESVAICDLKRFVADRAERKPPQKKEERPERVAVIGSGPAGLSAAYYLSLEGYRVTVFEKLPSPGGMLRAGIPAYRLPRDVLDGEIEFIQNLGVEIKTNTAVGKDITIEELFSQGFKALFIASGAYTDLRLEIPGEDGQGVIPGLVFLGMINSGQGAQIGARTAIIGGGNVAIDAARSALRIGAREVTILYRRSREEMPANDEEIEEALAEGIQIQYLTAPSEIVPKGKGGVEVRCIRMRLGEPDETGRRRPIPIEGSEFSVEVDTVIPAIGQAPDLAFISSEMGIELTEGGRLRVDPITLQTSREGIFAGGDAVTGPAYAIEAVGAGREAAISIHRYLNGQDLKEGREPSPWQRASVDDLLARAQKIPRQRPALVPPDGRRGDFQEVELALSEDEALREAQRCLNCGLCSECLQCVPACKAEAVDHQMQDKIEEFQVGSIILSPGFEEFDATRLGNYGYGRYPNVVSSTEFERILSSSGPFQGHLQRPSDGKEPQKIAWIQCVGSRDPSIGCGFCSSVCCMYAIKEAVLAREHSDGSLDTAIFYMDMRTYGKDFDRYYERAKQENGVRFIRCIVSRVAERPKTNNLVITYVEDSQRIKEEEFDLVVLSVGIHPSRFGRELAEELEIELNQFGFCKVGEFLPNNTSKPGIFVCGTFNGPKDIPETVTQASGAAAKASSLLASARHSLTRRKEYPPEREVAGQEPRIGVFVCNCGINIAGVVNVPEVTEYAETLPNVVFADQNLYTCSQDTQEIIKEKVAEHNLNRVVVAACSPRTHEPLFRETLREGQLNQYLFEMTNIRDQCSWVHAQVPKRATEKAKDLVRMAVAKASLIEPLTQVAIDLTATALVIGGGISGMTSALNLAGQGFEVSLVEKSDELGGNGRRIYRTLNGGHIQPFIDDMIAMVNDHPLIHVYLGTRVIDSSGYVGNFTSKLRAEDGTEEEVRHGVTIMAVGGQEYRSTDYFYGEDERVRTAMDLEGDLADNPGKYANCSNVVMIQCIGSRNEERPYCSRVCCGMSVKNALKLKELNPQVNIYILYRDMRTYGLMEDFFTEARNRGVVFIRFDPEDQPVVRRVKENGRDLLRVEISDAVIGERLTIDADLLQLATGILPPEDNRVLSQIYKVPLNQDGFFLEAHVKLRPVDFATEGVFLCGLSHSPKGIDESISQASAAASRASTILSKDKLEAEGIISSIDKELCSGCQGCIDVCPYLAISYVDEEAKCEINEALCKGCGACVATCSSGSIRLAGFRDDQIYTQIEKAFE